jgi:hypothetical protein
MVLDIAMIWPPPRLTVPTRRCVLQVFSAHFGSLIWPTPSRCVFGTSTTESAPKWSHHSRHSNGQERIHILPTSPPNR